MVLTPQQVVTSENRLRHALQAMSKGERGMDPLQDLSLRQLAILVTVCTVRRMQTVPLLVRALKAKRSTVSKNVKTLADRGLLVTVPDFINQRCVLVASTEAGRIAVQSLAITMQGRHE